MTRVLVVGQTPPPHGGQARMIKTLLEGQYTNVELLHVRMCFSREMDELGRFSVAKVLHLLRVILEIFYSRIFLKTSVLYYPPSPAETLPMLRDIAILSTTRWMFKKTILHFHAAGISKAFPSLPWFLRMPYRWAYWKPDISIQLSEHNPDDGAFLEAGTQCLVPNGIADEYGKMVHRSREASPVCVLLFVGLIRESKGILILIDVVDLLTKKGIPVQANVVGKFESSKFQHEVMAEIERLDLSTHFEFPGVLTGTEKHQAFLDADIFCFPTYFESFGLVVAEAMQFELPVVASRGQGVQSLVVNGSTGFLTDLGEAGPMADCIERLTLNPKLRQMMGSAGRRRYLEEYTIDKFHERMDHCFSLVDQGNT